MTIVARVAPAVMAGALVAALWSGSLPAAASRGLILDGQAVQGGLVRGSVAAGTRVRLNGRDVRVSDDGVFLLGFGRDAPPRAELVLRWPDGSGETIMLAVRPRTWHVQRIDGLPASKVSPDPGQMRRIEEEAALVHAARMHDEPRTDFMGGFRWPLVGEITGVYGSQRILNGEPRRPHFGLDIAAAAGTPVRAPAAGIVRLAHPGMFLSGGTLVVDHGHGLSSTFIHLQRILVKPGARVEQGQVIAEVGATGRATGAHLDWRVNLLHERLDPALLVGPMPSPGD